MKVPGRRGPRVSIAGMVCYQPGHRGRLIYRHVCVNLATLSWRVECLQDVGIYADGRVEIVGECLRFTLRLAHEEAHRFFDRPQSLVRLCIGNDGPRRTPRHQGTETRRYIRRHFLAGIYGRHFGLDRMHFYNWGGTRIPIVLQADGGAPTAAALAVEQLQRWLARAESRSCGHGLAAGLPDNVWQCDFRVTGSVPSGARRSAGLPRGQPPPSQVRARTSCADLTARANR